MKSDDQLRAAIEHAMQQCCQASAPVVKLAECIESLKATGWELEDIRVVESTVLKLLSRILSPTDDPKERDAPEIS